MLSEGGRLLHIAGETGHYPDLSLDEGFVAQFAMACRNVATVVETAGGSLGDLVSMSIFVTDVDYYRQNLQEIGAAYQSVFGKHFPAMALIGITELVDPNALVEITAIAVVPN